MRRVHFRIKQRSICRIERMVVMIAKLWYRKILLGEKTIDDVPTKLRSVVEMLLESAKQE